MLLMKFLTLLILLCCSLSASGESAGKPNIIFILADDMGWGDPGAYGNEFHETPNMDRMAQDGMVFTNFHTTSPVCSPSRASILTGLYAERLGMTQPAAHIDLVSLKAHLPERDWPKYKVVSPKSTTRLDTSFLTLAEVLRESGYRTAHVGKWHLGLSPYVPLNHGFDIDIPQYHLHGPNGSYIGPRDYGEISLVRGEHIEDRMAEEAVSFIMENKDRPFFLNYWAFSVHSPYVAKPELIAKYQKKAEKLTADALYRHAAYAAMLETFDHAVGRLLDAVESAGIADNTIIILTSDNGPEVDSIRAIGQSRWTNAPEALWDIPITSSHPFKGGKGTLDEGGTRVPLFMVWPEQIRAASVSKAMFSGVDFFPSIIEMAGLPLPTTELDGISQVPAIKGGEAPRQFLYGYWPNYPAPRLADKEGAPGAWIQHNGYKLVRYFHDGPEGQDRLELYNLNQQPGEVDNVAAENPERVAQLLGQLEKHLLETGALVPFPNPNYKPGGE